ncbi:hypothetical protein [Curtobacterium sp. MCSS17_016]|uniref:hypothetical protein n=1 Tax=Curtobacterium sp. MCSS17_016 TaxID=2175644 RepID=UPI000DA95074|nr:hypothetical protein [Curtobacterium sp. MCSS17_016]WIE81121.1 hypothetical protein DEJ19_021840 [Curtobacterium sp. MCSS17_016]
MSIDSNGRSHAAAGTPGGGRFEAEKPSYDETVNLSSVRSAEFHDDGKTLRVTGGEQLHDMEEHGLSLEGMAASINSLRLQGNVSVPAPREAFNSEMAKVYGYTPATHEAKWVHLAGDQFTEAIVFERQDGAGLTLPAAYQQVAQQASLGEELSNGWAAEEELPEGTDTSRLRHESERIRNGLTAVAGKNGAGWLMHGLDAADFGYSVENADAE